MESPGIVHGLSMEDWCAAAKASCNVGDAPAFATAAGSSSSRIKAGERTRGTSMGSTMMARSSGSVGSSRMSSRHAV
eukprot:1809176-Lingulodinium_polyedra.AAC.1